MYVSNMEILDLMSLLGCGSLFSSAAFLYYCQDGEHNIKKWHSIIGAKIDELYTSDPFLYDKCIMNLDALSNKIDNVLHGAEYHSLFGISSMIDSIYNHALYCIDIMHDYQADYNDMMQSEFCIIH